MSDTLGELIALVHGVSLYGGVLSILIRRRGDFLGGLLYVSTSMGWFKSKIVGSLGPPTSTASTSSCEAPKIIAPWIP